MDLTKDAHLAVAMAASWAVELAENSVENLDTLRLRKKENVCFADSKKRRKDKTGE